MKKELGVLLAVSSLPSKYGIGDFGSSSYNFIDFLAKNKIDIWQILPLNNTSRHNCPYGAITSSAFDEMYVDPEHLIELNLLDKKELKELLKLKNSVKVNYPTVKKEKLRILEIAYSNINKEILDKIKDYAENNINILKYAYYRVLLQINNVDDWRNTDKSLWDLSNKEAQMFMQMHQQQIYKYVFFQYILSNQWKAVKEYANKNNIKIIGDLPIYLGVASLDVFLQPQAFKLDKNYNHTITGGVPGDQFNSNGQDWGSCIYDWEYLQKTNFKYIIDKITNTLSNYDVMRLDHFAGYVEHYEIPNHQVNNGKWVKGGGEKLFDELQKHINLTEQIVIESLGPLSKECWRIVDKYKLKGMFVLQFAFDTDDNNPNLPSNVPKNSIYYLGTHDNNTFIGYLEKISQKDREFLNKFTGGLKNNKDILIYCIKSMLNSNSETIILQAQDFLMQNEFYRMNYPGVADNCWEYRMPKNYKKQFEKTLKLINWQK